MEKRACITGATSGIGLAFARELDIMGYSTIIVGRNKDKLEKISMDMVNDCETVVCDLSSGKDTMKLAKKLRNTDLDLFVNNAGFGSLGEFAGSGLRTDLEMINVNVRAAHILMKAVLKRMIRNNYGNIINVSSSAGLMPGGPGMATYYATKSYLTSLTCSVNRELKEHDSNVFVCALCPGPVDTGFNDRAGVSFGLKGIDAIDCVVEALKGLDRKKMIIVPTFRMKLAVTGSRLIPRKLALHIISGQQHKKMENKDAEDAHKM